MPPSIEMNAIRRSGWFFGLFALSVLGHATGGPDSEAHGPSQNIADAMRSAAGAEIAFLPAGMLKDKGDAANLASWLQFPTDEVAVVSLRGAQIKLALERSVSLFPSPNSSFLQVSGLQVTFSRSAPADRRIQSVTVGAAALDEGRTYSVAMPFTLARGGLGYFKVWDRNQITRTLAGTSLESLVRGKPSENSAPRWTVGS